MSWTYTGDPSASNGDAIRYLVGDTDVSDQLVSDEEIAFSLAQEPGIYFAAATVADAIAAKFARQVEKAVGSLRLGGQQKHQHYLDLASRLRRKARTSVAPYCGGISQADKDNNSADTDRVDPFFTRDLHHHPGVQFDPSTLVNQ